MIKRTVIETIREYDNTGKLVKESVTETISETDSDNATPISSDQIFMIHDTASHNEIKE